MRTGVEGDESREDMAAADENQKDGLRSAKHLASDGPSEDFAGIGHIVDVRVAQLEQADHVARSRRNCAEYL